jgi:hypothetical protein
LTEVLIASHVSDMSKTTPKPKQLPSCNRMMEKIDAVLRWQPDWVLERDAHIPKGKLAKIRTGLQFMRADEIWRISQALDVPVSFLLDDDAAVITQPPRASTDAAGAILVNDGTNQRRADSTDEPNVSKAVHPPRRK